MCGSPENVWREPQDGEADGQRGTGNLSAVVPAASGDSFTGAGREIVALVTVPSAEVATRIARVAVEERVAAAVNIVPGLRSVFVWEGRVEEAAEWLLVIKSRIERLGALEARVRALHPYRVPSLVALPVVGGDGTYLAWIADRVRTKGGGEPDEE